MIRSDYHGFDFFPFRTPDPDRGVEKVTDSGSETLSLTLLKLTGGGGDLSEGLGAEAQQVRPHPPHQRTEHLLQ
jgi:hypothetical protein